jgi:hypothetical protein
MTNACSIGSMKRNSNDFQKPTDLPNSFVRPATECMVFREFSGGCSRADR